MPLILRVSEPLSLEDMPKMTTAFVAHDLRPCHAESRIILLSYSSREGIPKGRPSAAGVEFVVRFVERCITRAAVVDAGVGVVFIVFA